MQKDFGGIIWTNHAISRMRERGIKQGDAWATWRNPDSSRKGSNKNTFVYYRTIGSQKIEVVSKKNVKSEWIILSVWSTKSKQNVKTRKSFLHSLLERIFS